MELAGVIVASLSLLATAVTYICDKLLLRKQRTIEKLSELKNSYHDNIAGKDRRNEKDYYRNCVRFFGNVEQFCAGVLSGYYSYGAARDNGSRFITMLYNDFKDYLIEQRRTLFQNENYYQNLEKLVSRFNSKKMEE